jgi:hypothetical protein
VARGSILSSVITNFLTENFDEMALEMATHKPLCWFHYMDDMFVIWPYGADKLTNYLDHLKSVYEGGH